MSSGRKRNNLSTAWRFYSDKRFLNCCFITTCKAMALLTHTRQQKFFVSRQGRGYNRPTLLIISTALDVTDDRKNFCCLYVSFMGLRHV